MLFFRSKRSEKSVISKTEALPEHIAIIMDGNGRWAKKRGLPRLAGHAKGAEVFGKIARHAAKKKVEYLTAYAFSTENWNRPREEVDGIMNILREFLSDAEKYRGDNMRLRIIGNVAALDEDICERIYYLQDNSKDNDGLNLNIALNYGGRDELLNAAKALARHAVGNPGELDTLDESGFAEYLYTAGMPDVDLVIRTSGEYRVSNFLLWQSAYAEYVFTDVLWPDFKPKHFDEALKEYSKRIRRYGGI